MKMVVYYSGRLNMSTQLQAVSYIYVDWRGTLLIGVAYDEHASMKGVSSSCDARAAGINIFVSRTLQNRSTAHRSVCSGFYGCFGWSDYSGRTNKLLRLGDAVVIRYYERDMLCSLNCLPTEIITMESMSMWTL